MQIGRKKVTRGKRVAYSMSVSGLPCERKYSKCEQKYTFSQVFAGNTK